MGGGGGGGERGDGAGGDRGGVVEDGGGRRGEGGGRRGEGSVGGDFGGVRFHSSTRDLPLPSLRGVYAPSAAADDTAVPSPPPSLCRKSSKLSVLYAPYSILSTEYPQDERPLAITGETILVAVASAAVQ